MKVPTRSLCQQLAKSVERYSRYHPNPLSIRALVDFGVDPEKTKQQMISYQFLRQELPVRLANIMKEFQHLPSVLRSMPSVCSINDWYQLSFKELTSFEHLTTVTDDLLRQFANTLVHIRDRHSSVVETMAQGIMELRESQRIDPSTASTIQYFLDRFYMNRISIRVLINHHSLLFGGQRSNAPRHIGCFDPECNVQESVEDAYENAKFVCEQHYQVAPGLHIECRNIDDKANPDVNIVYVPSHLYHMLFELFKNAMRATVERYDGASKLPAINVLICKGAEDLSIKMSDLGGGIPRSKRDQLFQYMYSTAPQPSSVDNAPMAGYGYGLPISRLYARYFHGELSLHSVEGHGTDAFISLKVLSDQASEVLPVYNSTVCKVYERDIPVNDWSSPQPWSSNHKLHLFFNSHHNSQGNGQQNSQQDAQQTTTQNTQHNSPHDLQEDVQQSTTKTQQ